MADEQPQPQPQPQPQAQPEIQPQQAPQPQAPQPSNIQLGGTAPQQQQPQQAPPPPPANAQEVIARQQAALQQQMQEARARDRAQFGDAAPGAENSFAPPLGGALIQGAPQQAPAGVNPAQVQGAQPQAAQPAPAQQFIGSMPQGMTAAQLAAGISPQQQEVAALQEKLRQLQQQGQPVVQQAAPQQVQQQPNPQQILQQVAPQYAQQPQFAQQSQIAQQPQHVQQQPVAQNQFAQNTPQPPPNKQVIRWHPGRNSNLQIELNDVIISGIPEDIKGEPDPQAKVVAALFSEILSLRNRIIQLENGSGAPPAAPPELERRVGMLEMTLMQQTQSLTQSARAAREEAVRQLLVEQQATAGQPGGVPVVDPSQQPQPQIQADAGDGPAGTGGAA
jgi:hypothetical protein